MSKEAVGINGAVLGSGEYWNRVSRSTFFGGLMQQTSGTDFWETLRKVGSRANSMVDEIYRDLQAHSKQLPSIDSGRRNQLAKQVQGLYDVCRMAGYSCSHSSECKSMLNLSGFFGNPLRDDRAIQAAIHKIKNSSDFFTSEAIDLVRQAADWSIPFAAGSSEKKRSFLEDLSRGRGRDFMRNVADSLNSSGADTRGTCGYPIGSSDYLDAIERAVFQQDIPAMHSARWGNPNYDGFLKDALDAIAHQLERDLEHSERENNYITDETARNLKTAVSELEHCGVSTGSADRKIEKLAWFVGGDPAKIRQLQSKLNQLGVGEHLTEDGVYGKKTLAAWENFFSRLEHGSVPTLTWINPLQTAKLPLYNGQPSSLAIGNSAAGFNNTIKNLKTGHQYFRFDPPHISPKGVPQNGYFRGIKRPINYNHVNINFGESPTAFQAWLQKQYNHYPLSDGAYDALKDLKATGKKVRIAGKVLLVAGIALDALELETTIDADLKDANRKIGKKTYSTAASIGGSWAGAALGAKFGALAGAATGPAAPVAVPILSLVGGIGGAFGGDALGRYIVDITCTED